MKDKTKFNPLSKDYWQAQLGVGIFLSLFTTGTVKTVSVGLMIVGFYNLLSEKSPKIHPIIRVLITVVTFFAYTIFVNLLTG